jgi:hypothetical protein
MERMTTKAEIRVDTYGQVSLHAELGHFANASKFFKKALDGGAFVQRANPSEGSLLFEWESNSTQDHKQDRKELAKAAMQGLLPAWDQWTERCGGQKEQAQAFAETAVYLADALLLALSQTSKELEA